MVKAARSSACDFANQKCTFIPAAQQLRLFERALARAVDNVALIATLTKWYPNAGKGAALQLGATVEASHLRRALPGIRDFCDAQSAADRLRQNLIKVTCTQRLVLDFGQHLALGPTLAVLDHPAVRLTYLCTEGEGPCSCSA